MEREKDTDKVKKNNEKTKHPSKKYTPKLPYVFAEKTTQKRQNEQETEKRVFELVDMIVKGKSQESCLNYIVEKYGIKRKNAEYYYRSAIDVLIPKNMDEYKAEVIAKNFKRLETIIEKTMDRENYRDAIQALKEINRIVCPNNNTVSVATTDTVFQIKFGNE